MKRATWMMIFVLIPAMAAHAVLAPEDIAGIWLLDEGSGNFAEDSSGNEHEGEITGTDWVDGKFGSGLEFDDAGSVTIQSTEKLQIDNEFTMMGYFYATTLDDWHQIIAKDAEYLLRIDPPAEGGKMSAFISQGGWEPRASASVPIEEVWTHFAAVYDGDAGTLTVYVDGVQGGQSGRPANPNFGIADLTFGHWAGGSNFVGILDELAIFKVVMEEDDIMDIATLGLQEFLEIDQSVEPVGKLTGTWGEIKEKR